MLFIKSCCHLKSKQYRISGSLQMIQLDSIYTK
uniref:Uncharacterized protein n=1 Tax=Arundo donax TaxID=35708 RepID=A0A0A9HK11_ARUDO